MDDSFRSIREEDGPVEAEGDDEEEHRHYHLVDRLNGRHTSAHREPTNYDGQPVIEDWPESLII